MAGLREFGGEDLDAEASLDSMLAFLTAGFGAPLGANGVRSAQEIPVVEAGEG
jgi:hypothetical protein